MSRYIAHLHQGAGCDYTIGCGHKIIHLNARNGGEAEAEIKALLIGDNAEYIIDELESVTLYEVVGRAKINLAAIQQAYNDLEAQERRVRIEEAERSELMRLSQKYGNPI